MRARGMWYMLSGLEFSRSLIEHIVKLTDFVRDHRVEVKELSKIGSANLSCAFASVDDQSSFCIGSDDLLILGEAGVYISITLYPPNDDNVHEEEIEPSTP